MNLQLGRAFLMDAPTAPKKHLYVVIGENPAALGTWLAVGMTSDENRADDSCVLQEKDYSHWINRETYVSFSDSLVITPEIQVKMAILARSRHVIFMPNDFEFRVLRRIIEAGRKSDALATRFKDWLK